MIVCPCGLFIDNYNGGITLRVKLHKTMKNYLPVGLEQSSDNAPTVREELSFFDRAKELSGNFDFVGNPVFILKSLRSQIISLVFLT